MTSDARQTGRYVQQKQSPSGGGDELLQLTQHWLALALEGDHDAFSRLYQLHGPRVKVYFHRSGFGPAEADDLTQDTFIRVYRSLHTFDPKRGKFRTWVSTIARNVARRRWSRRNEATSFDPELAEETLFGEDNPTAAIETRERIEAVRDCISRLNKELGQVVTLRYVRGLTTRAIGAEMKMAEATVRLRLGEAQGLLQRCLQGKGVLE